MTVHATLAQELDATLIEAVTDRCLKGDLKPLIIDIRGEMYDGITSLPEGVTPTLKKVVEEEANNSVSALFEGICPQSHLYLRGSVITMIYELPATTLKNIVAAYAPA